MRLLTLLCLFSLVACSSRPQAPMPSPEELESTFINKSASYYCYGNKNFLPCINPEIQLESPACIDYVVQNSKRCVDLHIRGADLAEYNAVKKIGVAYTQCSMIELLEKERVSFQSFERCFKVNYRQSDVHPKLSE